MTSWQRKWPQTATQFVACPAIRIIAGVWCRKSCCALVGVSAVTMLQISSPNLQVCLPASWQNYGHPPAPNDPVDHPLEEHIPMHYSYYSMCLPSCFTAVYLTVMLKKFGSVKEKHCIKLPLASEEYIFRLPNDSCRIFDNKSEEITMKYVTFSASMLKNWNESRKWIQPRPTCRRGFSFNIFYCWGICFETATSSYIYDRNKLGNMQR